MNRSIDPFRRKKWHTRTHYVWTHNFFLIFSLLVLDWPLATQSSQKYFHGAAWSKHNDASTILGKAKGSKRRSKCGKTAKTGHRQNWQLLKPGSKGHSCLSPSSTGKPLQPVSKKSLPTKWWPNFNCLQWNWDVQIGKNAAEIPNQNMSCWWEKLRHSGICMFTEGWVGGHKSDSFIASCLFCDGCRSFGFHHV